MASSTYECEELAVAHKRPHRHRVRRIMDAIQVGAATAAAVVELIKLIRHS